MSPTAAFETTPGAVPDPAPAATPTVPAMPASPVPAVPAAALPTAGGVEGDLFADPAQHLAEALATGTDAADTDTSWFCTTARDGRFVSRTRWHLWEDGTGRVGADELAWSAADDRLVLDSASVGTVTWTSVAVFDRFRRADGFTARRSGGRSLECERAGPARADGLFADDSGNDSLTTEEITGEGIDELLVTGRSEADTESFWSCTSTAGGVPVRTFELRLFDTGEAYRDVPGNWAALDRSTLLLSFEGPAEGSTLIWEDVVIPYRPAEAFDRFVAVDENEIEVACQWAGRSRT